MKKTITCATTSLLLIGILTLQTLAINFKSEENIDNLVFPFIYSDADDLVWVRKYVGDCSTCIEGRLYVKDMVTGEVKEIVSDAVKQLRESEDTLYCITNDGLSIIQTDCQGKKVTEIYKADYGMIDHLEVYGNNLCFTEGDYVVSFDLKKSEKTVVGRGANVLYLYPLTETEFVWVTGENGEASVYDSITNEVIDVEHIELLQINGKGNVHFNELDTVKDVTPQAILQETFPLSNYPVGSYFTVNGRACTDHGSGSCSTTGGCNCKSYDSSIQCMGFAKYASDQYAHRGSWSYQEIARLGYVSKAYLVLAAIGTSGGALNLLAQMLINQANQYEADQRISFFRRHPDIDTFVQQHAAPYGWPLNDNYALAYRVLQSVCGIQRGSQPYGVQAARRELPREEVGDDLPADWQGKSR